MSRLITLSKICTAVFIVVVVLSMAMKSIDLKAHVFDLISICLFALPHLVVSRFVIKSKTEFKASVFVISQFVIGALCAVPIIKIAIAPPDVFDGIAYIVLAVLQLFAFACVVIVISIISLINRKKI